MQLSCGKRLAKKKHLASPHVRQIGLFDSVQPMCGGMQLGNDLTKRCSQPLTSTVSSFKFGKQLSMLVTLAPPLSSG